MTMSRPFRSTAAISKQAKATRLINSLADTGLVERRPCKQDRRLIFICLSAYGEAQMDKLRRRSAGELKSIFSFSPRENRRSCCFPLVNCLENDL